MGLVYIKLAEGRKDRKGGGEWEGLGHARTVTYFHQWFAPLRSPQKLALPSQVPKKEFPGGGEGHGIAGF